MAPAIIQCVLRYYETDILYKPPKASLSMYATECPRICEGLLHRGYERMKGMRDANGDGVSRTKS